MPKCYVRVNMDKAVLFLEINDLTKALNGKGYTKEANIIRRMTILDPQIKIALSHEEFLMPFISVDTAISEEDVSFHESIAHCVMPLLKSHKAFVYNEKMMIDTDYYYKIYKKPFASLFVAYFKTGISFYKELFNEKDIASLTGMDIEL